MDKKEQLSKAIEQLLLFAKENLELSVYDEWYARNALLDLFRLTAPYAGKAEASADIQKTLDCMVDYAIGENMISADENILFETRIFGIVSPAPSAIVAKFNAIKESDGIKAATDWLFAISKANNYIRMIDINKNIMWEHSGNFGDIVVTINLSKPEKDPKQIAAALKAKTGYPACMLCPSNVGFAGNAAHPARQTLRIIPVTMGGEQWYIQYSPYQYYGEHLIALCEAHRPMAVDGECLRRLTDFVEQYPHYFMGSNAALPIVGGSILTHDHYQGGGKSLPMFKADIRKSYISPFDGVNVSTVNWYNSVVRVSGEDKNKVVAAATAILNIWKDYSDESVGILHYTDAQHNAVTPIARREGNQFVIDMILRNNRTDENHPYGIYHPTEDLHNIKKEGIGIIEVMGTFILPGRLNNELKAIEDILTGGAYDRKSLEAEASPLAKHADMIDGLLAVHGNKNSADNAHKIVTDYVNNACERILECTAVFKNTETGQNAFNNFMINAVGCKEN